MSDSSKDKPTPSPSPANEPLENLEEWEDFLKFRYTEEDLEDGIDTHKDREDYRNYEDPSRDSVKEFYRLNHQHQTFDFVKKKKEEYLKLDKEEMSTWDAIELLNTLIDDSDPDNDLPQIIHLLQSAEAVRAKGHPDWFILTGLIHDLGKLLCHFGEPQWAVVGDTFPVGCAFSDKIVYPEYFEANADSQNEQYQTDLGIYEEGCGLDNVQLSWGHDEYMYHVVKDYLPEPALYMIRYHSFYPCHTEGAYQHLMNDHDREMFKWVRAFNPFDLYSKCPVAPKVSELKSYYQGLIDKYLPSKLCF